MSTFTNSIDPDKNAAFHQGRKVRHFIRVYTVCKGKKDLQTKIYNIFFFNYNLAPLDMYNGLSQVYCIKSEGRIHKYTFRVKKGKFKTLTRNSIA